MDMGEQRVEHDEPGTEMERPAFAIHFDPSEALSAATKFAKEHPHAALLGACAAGFILGGGLTPKLMGAIAFFAARRYFVSSMEEAMEAIGSAAAQQAMGPSRWPSSH